MPLIAGYALCYVESNSNFPVSDFLFARSQMGMSLAFHIVFAAIGISLPVLMVISEALYLRTGRPVFLELGKRWSRGAAILFAVGAVSGTVLSFELGLLWPGFMEKSGAIIGMPFSLEGFAFFTEAIFLGLYLMGWKRLPPLVHWFCGVLVILGGVTSGIFVVTANAWMNTPAGFKIVDGKITDIDPIGAMLNPAAAHEILAHDSGCVYRNRICCCCDSCLFPFARSPKCFSSQRIGHRARACLRQCSFAIDERRLQRALGRETSTSQTGGHGSRLPDTNRRAVAACWHSRRPITHHALCPDHSARPQPSGKSRSEQQDHWAGSISA